jgi:hypothetical protein
MELDDLKTESRQKREERRNWKKKDKKRRPRKIRFEEEKEDWLWNTVK